MRTEAIQANASVRNIGQEKVVSFTWVDAIIDALDVQVRQMQTVSHVLKMQNSKKAAANASKAGEARPAVSTETSAMQNAPTVLGQPTLTAQNAWRTPLETALVVAYAWKAGKGTTVLTRSSSATQAALPATVKARMTVHPATTASH